MKQYLKNGVQGAALIAAGALLVTGCSSPAEQGSTANEGDQAQQNEETHELVFLTAATPGTPTEAVQNWYLDTLEEATDGRLTFDRTAAESLCSAPEIVQCLKDGRGDLGLSMPDYTPQDFPTVSVVGIPFLNQNSQAVTSAMYELHQSNPEAIANMEQNNLHFVSNWPSGRLLFGSDKPLTSVEDIDGLRARTNGPVVQQILQDAGMSMNAITASETYESVDRGLINAVGGAIDFPVNFGLMELLPYWSDAGMGQYATFGMWFSKDAYDELPADIQEIIEEVSAELNNGAGVEAFNKGAQSQCQKMLDASSVKDFTAWSDEAVETWQNQIGDKPEQKWLEVATDFGMEDPEAYLAEYKRLYEANEDADYFDVTLDCIEQFKSR